MANRPTSSTPGRLRKLPPITTNSQMTFDNNIDLDESDEDAVDENFPITRDVPFYDHHARQAFTQRSNSNKNNGAFYTPQVKRKRFEDQATRVSQDFITEEINLVKLMLKESHQKMDMIFKKQENIEKRFDHVNKTISGLSRHVIKRVTTNPPPEERPIIDYNGRNLLSGPPQDTPSDLMKFLINELFTKQEIMEGQHEELNERTEKIKDAVQICFFHNDPLQFELFWNHQGKSTRGNQRRGHNYRKKHSKSTNSQETVTVDDNNDDGNPTTTTEKVQQENESSK